MNPVILFLTCVISISGNFEGVVVSRNIFDKTTGETWVIVETKDGTKTENIKNLKEKNCVELDLKNYKNKDYILELLGRY